MSPVPTLEEPTTIIFDHEPLHDADLDSIRTALDEAHLVVVHAPSWSVAVRRGVLVRIGFDVGDEGHTAASAAVESSSVWASLGSMNVVIVGEVVVELRRDEDARQRTDKVRPRN